MSDPIPAPTQTQHPWRATIRTVVAGILALIPIAPVLVDYLGVGAVPWVAGTLAVLATVTRVLAIPAVNGYVQEYLPWLAATPRQP
jgi:hypothetical protein